MIKYEEGAEWGGRSSQREFCFKLLIRHGEFGLLVKQKDAASPCYEVVRIRKRKKDVIIKGRLAASEGDEYLPRDEEWGAYGWSYTNKRDALEKLMEVGNEAKT